MALRQKIRLTLLFLIFLTFPITLNYFSVYLIIGGSSQGIMTFSFFFWVLFTLTALFFGRAACGYQAQELFSLAVSEPESHCGEVSGMSHLR
jgi:hypothetical protein